MRKSILFAITLLLTFMLHAQDPYKQGRFVIQGKVKGYTDPTFDFYLSSFFDGATNSVIVKGDGTFSQSFPIQHRQRILFFLNNEDIKFTVHKGDTLKLNWDNNNFEKTFRIAGKNKLRTKELAIEKALNKVTSNKDLLYDSLANLDSEPDPKAICHALNNFYNQEVQLILDSAAGIITSSLNYLLTDIYFDYARTMRQISMRSPETFRPVLQLDKNKTYPSFWIADTVQHPDLHRVLREDWWLNVPRYRDYLFDYVRFTQSKGNGLFETSNMTTPSVALEGEGDFNKAVASTPPGKIPELFAFRGIQQGNKYIPITTVREWYNTKVVIDGFSMYPFEETEKAYHSLVGRLKTVYLRDTLQKFYRSIQRLRPGNPAPAFTLQDEKGNKVSLADFKGKVVYIDFWGVGCGPCIYEIINHVPYLQKRYQDKDVVFLNICVDAKGKEWTDALRKYNLGGVNLYADGWTENPVCKDYNINGIPNYVLIDKAGNIVNNRAPRASELLDSGRENAIDALLK